MKKITKKLIILFGIILINTFPMLGQGGGTGCPGDNLMEIQNYGYGSCNDLLFDGYPIGADPFLDEICCGTFSAYSNGNCPGDNMDFMNGKGYQIKMFEDVYDFQFCKTIIRQ